MDLSQKIPLYLTEPKNILKLVLFTAVFALVFINLYSPFQVEKLIQKAENSFELNRDLIVLITSSLIILTGVLVIVISRIILYIKTRMSGSVSFIEYLIWIAVEIIAMAVFYAVFEEILIKDARSFLVSFRMSIQNTALVLLIPYSVSWLYFSWIDKNKMLEKLKEGEIAVPVGREMIFFHDEKGTMRLSMKFSELLYLQAADNYVNIVYKHRDKQSKYMLRSSLKLLEEQFKNFPLVRCHRSYIVNFDHVKIIRREKDGLKIELDSSPDFIIPVSSTYMDEVFKSFGHFKE
ncbi:MAG: LytTR family transcriptional regulator [Bacteroidales bacterium]|nr:LytTR family transcriptional regulator [Bacteroidales bacterium]